MSKRYAGLRVWQVLAAAAFLVIGFGGSYVAYRALTGSEDQPSDKNQQLIPVTRGNLVNDVSINGSVKYPNRKKLYFGTKGTVAELLVEEGEAVDEGQRLALIDSKSVAALKADVAKAEVELRDANKALKTALDPFTRLDVAQAESKVAGAKVALEEASKKLTALTQPSRHAIAEAEEAVANARTSLTSAQEALAKLTSPGGEAVAKAEARPDKARVALNNAQEALTKLVSPDAADLEKAEANVVKARVALNNAREALTKLTAPDAADLKKAEADAVKAKVALNNAREALAKLVSPVEHDVKQAEAKVTGSGIALAEAKKKLSRLVDPGARQIAEAEAAVADAEKALADAIEALGALTPSAEALAKARSSVTEAKEARADALEDLRKLDSGPSVKDVSKLQLAVDQAEASLTSARLDVELVSEEWEDKIKPASKTVNTAAREYVSVFRSWLGIEISGDQARMAPAEVLDFLDLDLDSIFAVRPVASNANLPADDPDTKWDEHLVHIWLNLYPGMVITTCSPDADLLGGTRCISREMDKAWDALSDAIDALNTVEANADKATLGARAAVDKAMSDLGDAQDALAELMKPPTSLKLESARVRVDAALAKMESAQDELARLEAAPIKVDVDLRETKVALARTGLQQAKDKLDKLTEPDPLDVEAAQNEVTLAEAKLAEDEKSLAELTPDPLDVEAAQNEVALAEAKLAEDEKSLAKLITPDPLDVEAAHSEVTLAEAKLAEDEKSLAKLITPDPLDVEAAHSEVALAEAELDEAISQLAKLTQPNEQEIELKQKEVALAEAELEKAESQLAKLMAPDPRDVEKQEKEVEVAQALLGDAVQKLEDVTKGADPLDVTLKRLTATAATASLEAARESLAASTITAPWRGVVSEVKVEVGQAVDPNTMVLEVVDPLVVEINGAVDEIDVLFIRKGATASVTMDARAGQAVQGVVSKVGSVANSQSGVVTYPISIRMQVPAGVDLPEGLSAVATVVLREDNDVLLLPVDALYGSYEQPIVKVSQDGSFEDREVGLGNNDGFWVVIESGVSEGELALMKPRETASRGMFGMGFGP